MMSDEAHHAESVKVGRQRRRSVIVTWTAVALIIGLLAGGLSATVANSFTTIAVLHEVQEGQEDTSPTQQRLLDIISAVQATSDRIYSCTDPTGECYRKSQRETAGVVGNLNEVTVVASACAAGFASLPLQERVRATRQCVTEILQPKQH